MDLLTWIVVGIVAGFLAKAVVPGEGPGGVLGDLVVGIVGAVMGGWIMHAVGEPGLTGGISIWSIVVAFVGAVVFLILLRALTSRRSTY